MEQHRRAHTHGQALDGSDQRLVEACNGADEGECSRATLRSLSEVLKVIACAEGVTLSCDQDSANVAPRRSVGKGCGHAVVHGCGKRVLLIGAVDVDFQDAALFDDFDPVAHDRLHFLSAH